MTTNPLLVVLSFFSLLSSFFSGRETNLKFKMGLRVTDERLQEERQLAAFNGEEVVVDVVLLKPKHLEALLTLSLSGLLKL